MLARGRNEQDLRRAIFTTFSLFQTSWCVKRMVTPYFGQWRPWSRPWGRPPVPGGVPAMAVAPVSPDVRSSCPCLPMWSRVRIPHFPSFVVISGRKGHRGHRWPCQWSWSRLLQTIFIDDLDELAQPTETCTTLAIFERFPNGFRQR